MPNSNSPHIFLTMTAEPRFQQSWITRREQAGDHAQTRKLYALCDAARQASNMQTKAKVAVRDGIVSCCLISAGKEESLDLESDCIRGFSRERL